MSYITLDEAKKHLNVDADFHDDDQYITWLIDVAEASVAVHLCCPLAAYEDGNGKIPAPIKHAALLFIGDLYANREVNAYTNVSTVPFGYEHLINLYKCYADVTSEAFLQKTLVDIINRLEIEKSTGRLILHQNPNDYYDVKGKAKQMVEDDLLVEAGRLFLAKQNG